MDLTAASRGKVLQRLEKASGREELSESAADVADVVVGRRDEVDGVSGQLIIGSEWGRTYHPHFFLGFGNADAFWGG